MNPFIARALVLPLAVTGLHAEVPQLINYQGRVAVHGVNFAGPGKFKFAIVDAGGTTSYWSNDGTSIAGSEPEAAIKLTVTGGLYSVLLGDTTLRNMAAIPEGVFKNSGVLLRVWFNDGSNGSQLLTPDQRLATPAEAAPGHAGHVRDGIPLRPDAWQQRSDGTPPTARYRHTAVWTGSEMIVWSGRGGGFLNDGWRYDPAGNSWTAVGTSGAPAGRQWHTAVWTGSEMIVWGGQNNNGLLNDGGRYYPAGNNWMPIVNTLPNTPAARGEHTAVWTGSEMIVWGGYGSGYLNTGGRYNPAGNNWTPVTTTGAPTARREHTAVWTGSEMIVWGGYGGSYLNTEGQKYHPAGNSWTPVTTTGAPAARSDHTAVWTGSEMIVWGGYQNGSYLNTGGRYHPAGNSWTPVNTTGAPGERQRHTAVWTGSEMIVWGGEDLSSYVNDGGRYSPTGNSWTLIVNTLPNTPAARLYHTAVWTGSGMIVWGGEPDGGGELNDGGRYRPAVNSWTAVNPTGAPGARHYHTAVWAGSEMIVWGGLYYNFGNVYLNDGGRYNPSGNSWTPVTSSGAPAARLHHTAVWTGSEMIVWGGGDSSDFFNDTFSYTFDPGDFPITSVVRSGGNFILSFPTLRNCPYSLWRSDNLTNGSWTHTGLTTLGNGAIRTFTVPLTGPARGFFRVQASP